MKEKSVYEEELNKILQSLQTLEQQKAQLTTRAVELQGVIKAFNEPEEKKK
jgi:hypothetical protein